MKLDQLRTELNVRRSEWTSLANQAFICRKTIERTASGITTPSAEIAERLSALLKKRKQS